MLIYHSPTSSRIYITLQQFILKCIIKFKRKMKYDELFEIISFYSLCGRTLTRQSRILDFSSAFYPLTMIRNSSTLLPMLLIFCLIFYPILKVYLYKISSLLTISSVLCCIVDIYIHYISDTIPCHSVICI